MARKFINLPDLIRSLEEKGIIVTDTDETSLTAPQDVKPVSEKRKARRKKDRRIVLSPEELDAAAEKLIRNYPSVEKRWNDPPLANQKICLTSFIPAQGATPDKHGVFGYVKVRGTFSNEIDAEAHGNFLLQNADSHHAICHGYVGQPLPMVQDENDTYVHEVVNVDLAAKLGADIAADVKSKRDQERKEAEEAKERGRKAQQREEAEMKGEVDLMERYIMRRTKRANLIFSIVQMIITLKKYKDTLLQTIQLIEEDDTANPAFQTEFLARYEQAAKEVGIPREKNHIIRYMAGPVPFDLNIIPDTLQIDAAPVPEILPVNLEAMDPGLVAEKMTKLAENGGILAEPVKTSDQITEENRRMTEASRMSQKMSPIPEEPSEKKSFEPPTQE